MIPATATKPTGAPCEITRMAANETSIEKASDGHADRDGCERQRNVTPEPVDFREHLLRREHEGEQRPLHAAGRQRITQGLPIAIRATSGNCIARFKHTK